MYDRMTRVDDISPPTAQSESSYGSVASVSLLGVFFAAKAFLAPEGGAFGGGGGGGAGSTVARVVAPFQEGVSVFGRDAQPGALIDHDKG